MKALRSLLALGVAIAGLVACGSSDSSSSGGDGTKTCVAHTDPPPAMLAAPVTSFETDVAPILAQSCAFSSCHGSQGPGNHGLFLSALGTDIATVKSGLLATSQTMPTEAYVKPGDPDNSFLLHKLDGDLCVIDDKCVNGTCGDSMPMGNDPLPDTSRDTIRRWVSQGAK